jgi:hypothetical protein
LEGIVGMDKSINPMNRKRTIIIFIILFLTGISCDEEPSSCYDKLQNGDETGIDCGGNCPPCSCFNGIKDDNEDCINYLEDFVQKGYVVANIIGIRYWQERIPLNNGAFNQVAMLIREDIRGAVRYFRKNREAYHIDTANIWLMGASMGAMAALHAAYLDETDFSEIDQDLVAYIENDQGINPEIDKQIYTSRVKGVVILSGMIFDTRIIDHGEPYLYSAMGSEDAYRPFQCDMVTLNWIQEPHYFCGPEAMEERMKQEGFKIDSNGLSPHPLTTWQPMFLPMPGVFGGDYKFYCRQTGILSIRELMNKDYPHHTAPE